MLNTNLTLVIPSLLPRLAHQTDAKLPNLQKLLARAEVHANPSQNLETLFFNFFSLPHTAELPIAALTGLADGLATDDGYWLRLDPIELRTSLAAVYLLGNEHLAVPPYLKNLLTQLQTLAAADDLEFFAPSAKRWYLKTQHDPQIKTFPPDELIGKDISKYLPVGAKQTYWRKLLTEIQMLMLLQSQSPQSYGQSGEMLNAVWLWGEGQLPARPTITPLWQYIWTDDVLVQGLAQFTQTPAANLPARLNDCLKKMVSGSYLITLQPSLRLVDAALLEQNWFAPLVAALKTKQLTNLDLYVGDNNFYRITQRTIHYFWRRHGKVLTK